MTAHEAEQAAASWLSLQGLDRLIPHAARIAEAIARSRDVLDALAPSERDALFDVRVRGHDALVR